MNETPTILRAAAAVASGNTMTSVAKREGLTRRDTTAVRQLLRREGFQIPRGRPPGVPGKVSASQAAVDLYLAEQACGTPISLSSAADAFGVSRQAASHCLLKLPVDGG